MAVNKEAYIGIVGKLKDKNVTLVAVSKTKPIEDIKEMYDLGQRDFGENYVQELAEKASKLPKDIHWHFIGHLQSNKVKSIASFVHLIHGVDSPGLLKEINKQAAKNNRIINCLLQVHIAREETKFGLDEKELHEILHNHVSTNANTNICGLMGMASFTSDMNAVRKEFSFLKTLFDKYTAFFSNGLMSPVLSMGMSSDYEVATEEGSTMVRIGTLLFGNREKKI